ncbi:MAG: hypothetical protein JWR02_1538 [Mucilaginibacter sp.]|nr:hypothetical protein [Mucilaginibacter sp.]
MAGQLSIDARNVSISTLKASKPSKAVYYVENADILGDNIDVDYTLNDDWKSTSLNLQALTRFIITNGLNDYCYDSSDHRGEHIQDSGTIEIGEYLAENLKPAVRAYLQSIKAGQYNFN